MLAVRSSMLVLAWAVLAAAAEPTLSLSLGHDVEDLVEAPDGTVQVLSETWSPRTSATRVYLHRLGAAGAIGKPVRIDRGLLDSSGTFLPGGSVLLVRSPNIDRGSGRGLPDALTVNGAARSKPAKITDARTSILGPEIGPTGAVLFRASRESRRSKRSGFIFRPAGATGFGRFVTLGSTRASQGLNDPDGDGSDTSYRYALAPDGGGAVLAIPDALDFGAPYLRRISPAGELGPRIDLGVAASGVVGGALEFGPTGKLSVVVAAVNVEPGDLTGVGATWATTLAPGATTAPAPQRLADADTITAYGPLLDVATGPGERVSIVTGVGVGDIGRRVRTFESADGGAFVEAAPALEPTNARDTRLFVRSDGGVTLLWDQDAPYGSTDDGAFAATRAPGEPAFGAPRRLTRKLGKDGYRGLDAVLPMSGNRLAIAYRDYDGADAASVVAIVQP